MVSEHAPSQAEPKQGHVSNLLTSVSDLAGIATRGGWSPLGEGNPDLAQGLGSGAGPDALIPGQDDLLDLPVRSLDLGLDGHDLVVEETFLLGLLGALETLGGVFVHLFPSDTEIPTDVLASPAHGLHGVGSLLARRGDSLIKRLVESIAADSHGLGANGDTDFDIAGRDGIGDIGGGLETRRAESIDGGGTGDVGNSGRQGGGAEFVRGFRVRDLRWR